MTFRTAIPVSLALLLSIGAIHAFQRPWRELGSQEGYNGRTLPTDYLDHNEFVIGRMMYPEGGGGFGRRGDWRNGYTNWSNDYPKGDRLFAKLLRRLTRIDARSVEQPVDLTDGDDLYHWPFLYVAHPGTWSLDDNIVNHLREYLARGGFFYVDDFWGVQDWQVFQSTMARVLPNTQIEDLPDNDPIFHTIFNLDQKIQVANHNSLRGSGVPYHSGGVVPYWRAIRDQKGRVIVSIAFNSDIGDSWEWADEPEYPQKYSNMGIQVSVNYAAYSLSH